MTDKDQSVDLIGGVTTDEAIARLLRDRCIAVEERLIRDAFGCPPSYDDMALDDQRVSYADPSAIDVEFQVKTAPPRELPAGD